MSLCNLSGTIRDLLPSYGEFSKSGSHFLVPLNIRCRNIPCNQKGPLILRTTYRNIGLQGIPGRRRALVFNCKADLQAPLTVSSSGFRDAFVDAGMAVYVLGFQARPGSQQRSC